MENSPPGIQTILCGALSGDWTVLDMVGRKFAFDGRGAGTEASVLEPKLVVEIEVDGWRFKYGPDAAIPTDRTASSSSRVEFSRRGSWFPRPPVGRRMVCIALRE
jgi:hypothetical protein